MYIIINVILVTLILFIIFKSSKIKKDKTIKFIDKNYKYIILILFILVVITSIYKLGVIPGGLNIDEAGTYYDAILLATQKTDRYLNRLPIYLINYGDGQSVMYAYLTALLIKIFGIKQILVRIPAILLRIIAFICACYLIKPEKNKTFKIIFLLLLAITPYFIMQSRFGLDCNILVSLITISLSFFVNYFYNHDIKKLLISGIFLGLSLYTYALSYIMIPIFLILIIIYLKTINKISIKELIVLGMPIFTLSVPLILMILVNNNIIPEVKSFITIPKLPHYRGEEISILNIFYNIRIILNIFTFDKLLKGYDLVFNATYEFGTLYYISIPFAIIGIIQSVKEYKNDKKRKKITLNTIMLFWFLSVLICMMIIYSPNINKANAIFISLIYFISIGIVYVIKNNKKLLLFIVIIYLFNYTLFLYFYFTKYNSKYNNHILFEPYSQEALKYVESLDSEYIYIEPNTFNPIFIYINNLDVKYSNNPTIIKTKNKTYIFCKINKLPEDYIYITRNNNINKDSKVKQFKDIYVIYN